MQYPIDDINHWEHMIYNHNKGTKPYALCLFTEQWFIALYN